MVVVQRFDCIGEASCHRKNHFTGGGGEKLVSKHCLYRIAQQKVKIENNNSSLWHKAERRGVRKFFEGEKRINWFCHKGLTYVFKAP
jgi:hypothetical protein